MFYVWLYAITTTALWAWILYPWWNGDKEWNRETGLMVAAVLWPAVSLAVLFFLAPVAIVARIRDKRLDWKRKRAV